MAAPAEGIAKVFGLLKLFEQLLAPSAERFRDALKHPEKTQQRVQQEICDRLMKSEYGKYLGIGSLQDWQQVPIVDYDDLKPWIYGVGAKFSRYVRTHRFSTYVQTDIHMLWSVDAAPCKIMFCYFTWSGAAKEGK
jgi:hypothetical protein